MGNKHTSNNNNIKLQFSKNINTENNINIDSEYNNDTDINEENKHLHQLYINLNNMIDIADKELKELNKELKLICNGALKLIYTIEYFDLYTYKFILQLVIPGEVYIKNYDKNNINSNININGNPYFNNALNNYFLSSITNLIKIRDNKVILEIISYTDYDYENKKYNLLLRAIVIYVANKIEQQMKLKFYIYSTAVNPISAYVLSKYFELEPPPPKHKNVVNNYIYNNKNNIEHTDIFFYKFIQKNKNNLTIDLINKYFNKVENALKKIIDIDFSVINILVPCNNSNSIKAKLIIDKLIQGVSTTGIKCPKIPSFHKYNKKNLSNLYNIYYAPSSSLNTTLKLKNKNN